MINYRIYGNHRQFGWELLNILYQEEKVHEFIKYINSNDYMTVIVVKHDFKINSDEPFLVKHLKVNKPVIRNRKK